MKYLLLLVILFAPALLFAQSPAIDNRNLNDMMASYIKAVTEGDWEETRGFWDERDLARSERLGIKYSDCPAKYDCASPLFTNHEKIQSGQAVAKVGNINMRDGYAQIEVLVQNGMDVVKACYYARKNGNKWRLVAPMRVLCHDWKIYRTKYANVFFRENSLVNFCALDEIDLDIEYIAPMLGAGPDKMLELCEKRLDYYLCTADDFKMLTGYDAQGITNLQFDAIITRQLPHAHELTHFLMNYALGELPLYTLPILQEGIAVALGGRYDKGPIVMLSLGKALLENNVCTVEELITWQGFNETVAMPDISYPVSAVFVRYLFDTLGMDNFRRLYLDCSGTDSAVRAITSDDFKVMVEKHSSLAWEVVKTDFDNYCQNREFSDLVAGFADFDRAPDLVLEGKSCEIKIWEDSLNYYFKADHIESEDKITLLMNYSVECMPDSYRSWLFAEHMPDAIYHGNPFSIRFDTQEAGFYYYVINQMEAKFVSSFQPQADYWDAARHTLKFRLRKYFLWYVLPQCEIQIIEQ